MNSLSSDRLRVGQQLIVSGSAPAAKSTGTAKAQTANIKTTKTEPSAEQSKGGFGLHTVKRGENLWEIAKKYPGVTTEMIKKSNNLSSSNLQAGQKLRIPNM